MLLPVIVGGSVGSNSKWRPYVIAGSLAGSLFLFTLLLKASTLLIDLNPIFLTYFSGIVVILLGLISLFPVLWDKISIKLNLSRNSDLLLEKAQTKQGLLGAVLTGAALGPVFSSCSPTYVFVLTTVLREDFNTGLLNILAYILGLTLIMLAVGLSGRKFVTKMRWAVNPSGIFKRVISILFILVGIGILTGFDKTLQSNLVPFSPVSKIEEQLLGQNKTNKSKTVEISNLIEAGQAKKAPEITGIQNWINSDPQTIEKLKGKVVLIDFWTYSCINCIRTQPYLNSWYETYSKDGFVILGIHAPEFAFEQKIENVQIATEKAKIKYPVGLDNSFKTWDAYENQFWPAKYLIDKNGLIRYTHFGEGDYDKTEESIRTLLKESGQSLSNSMVSDKIIATDTGKINQTPETYLGWSRAANFTNSLESKGQENKNFNYTLQTTLKSNNWSLGGGWIQNNQEILSTQDGAVLKLKYSAKEVYIVAGTETAGETKTIQITSKNQQLQASIKGADVDGNGEIKVSQDRLYKLIKQDGYQVDQEIELTLPKGTRLNAFTFGG